MHTGAVARIVQLFLLIGLGFSLRRIGFFSEDGRRALDKVVMRLALPATLFLAFADLDLGVRDLPTVAVVLLFCFSMYLFGRLIARLQGRGRREPLVPYLTSGLSFGLLGVPLFQMMYGFEHLGVFAKFGIGHEFFAWFFLFPALDAEFGVRKSALDLGRDFIKSPAVLAILAGLALGLSGAGTALGAGAAFQGFRAAVQALAYLASPLVLISVGYGIRFDLERLPAAAFYVALRLSAAAGLGFLLKISLVDPFVPAAPYLDEAFFLFTLLPPVFTLAMFAGPYVDRSRVALINNVIVLNTLATLVLFSAYSIFFR